MTDASWIRSPDDSQLDELCSRLESDADRLDQRGDWPSEQLTWCAEAGAWSWFLPARWGGQEWNERDIMAAYLKLGKACLTTTFITTQWSAAARRLAASGNDALCERVVDDLLRGKLFTTVGISHLTTSRRHLAKPVLAARDKGDCYVLDGFSPWVTGGAHADLLVTGAVLDDSRQLLLAVPTDARGVSPGKPLDLLGLSASATGPVNFHQVQAPKENVLAGPVDNVLAASAGSSTGGLQTSTLALASALAAIELIEREGESREDLRAPADELRDEADSIEFDLLRTASGQAVCTADELRVRANSLVLRASQAAMAAAKGTGYISGHRASRLCREALFFLVWSCPQPVVMANLCELAGLSD